MIGCFRGLYARAVAVLYMLYAPAVAPAEAALLRLDLALGVVGQRQVPVHRAHLVQGGGGVRLRCAVLWSGQALVKHWSSTGQNGQKLVVRRPRHVPDSRHGRCPMQPVHHKNTTKRGYFQNTPVPHATGTAGPAPRPVPIQTTRTAPPHPSRTDSDLSGPCAEEAYALHGRGLFGPL